MGISVFQIPPTDPRSVPRRVLLSLLREQAATLTYCIAPAGYGKSNLLQQWAISRGAFWCELDSTHATPQSLAAALVSSAALSPQFRDTDWENQLRHALDFNDPVAGLEWFFDSLRDAECDWSIAIDDVQSLENSPESCALLDRFIALALKSRGRLFICGRRPHASRSLANLSTRLDVHVLGSEDLAMSAEEVGEVLAPHTSGPVATPVAERVLEVSGGWPALAALIGKKLARISDANWLQELAAADAKSIGVEEYLEFEYFESRPELHRQFLLTLSLLSPVPEALCEHLFPEGGRKIARELVDGRFVRQIPAPDGPTYVIHDLVREFLRAKCFEEFGSKLRERIYASAAQWFADEGMYHEAFRHWKLAGQVAPMVDILNEWESSFTEYWSEYRDWISGLAPEDLVGRIRLQVRLAINNANVGNTTESLAWLARARTESQASGLLHDQRTVSAAEAITQFFAGNAEASLAVCNELQSAMPEMDAFQQGCVLTARILLHNNVFIDTTQAAHYLAEYERVISHAGFARGWLVATANAAVTARIRGDLDFQLHLRDRLEERWGAKPVPVYFRALILFSEALAMLELGLPLGRVRMEHALELLGHIGARQQVIYGRSILALHDAELGATEDPAESAPAIEGLYAMEHQLYRLAAAAFRAANRKDRSALDAIAAPLLATGHQEFTRALAHLELGRAYFRFGDSRNAIELIGTASQVATTGGFQAIIHRCDLLLGALGFSKETRKVPASFAEFATLREISFLKDATKSKDTTQVVSSIKIKLIGGLKVEVGGEVVRPEDWERPQARAFFAYLMLHWPTPVHGDIAIETFWPDSSATSGKANLKTTLSRIRRALRSDDSISFREGRIELHLGEELCFDLDQCRGQYKAIQSAEPGPDRAVLAQAYLESAQGGLLPEHLYADWAAMERTEFDLRVQNIQLLLGSQWLELGCFDEALRLASELIKTDRLYESGYRLAYSAHLSLGHAAEAKRVKQQWDRVLNDEFGLNSNAESFGFEVSR